MKILGGGRGDIYVVGCRVVGGNLMAPLPPPPLPLYEPPAGGAVHGRDAVPAAAAQARGAGHGHNQGLQLHAFLH